MAKSSTSFGKGNQPINKRGRNTRTLILEMFREESLLGLSEDSNNEECEKAFFKTIATSAFNNEDNNSGMCKKLLADKGWANLKPVSQTVEFELDESGDLHKQSAQILKAVASGDIPPDTGNNLINSLASMIKIKEFTDFEERLKAIEDAKKQAE